MSTKKQAPKKTAKVVSHKPKEQKEKEVLPMEQPQEEIIQPDPENPDPQYHIKEEAKKGQPMPTPLP